MKKITSLLFFMGLCVLSYGQEPFWQSLNPGTGGRVQGLSCDDSDPGRMFFASDVEGFYISDDYGESWEYGDPNHNIPSTFIQMAKGRGNAIYVGHGIGLSYSTNGGNTYSLVPNTKDKIISSIEIDPNNANNVYAGFGWQENTGTARLYPFSGFLPWNPGSGAKGKDYALSQTVKEVHYTNNGGASWNVSSWAGFSKGDGRVYSIETDPTNSNHVVMANADGLYVSTNKGGGWSKINAPLGIDVETCWGADFTPDGNFLYAIYRDGNFSRVYVKSYPNGSWQDVGKGSWSDFNNGNTAQPVHMWRPKVYEGSSATEHFVAFGQLSQNPKNRLIEARFTVSGTTVSQGTFTDVFGYEDGRFNPNGGVNYDLGWNPYQSTVRHNTYFPASWPTNAQNPYTRGMFSMSSQSFSVGDAAAGNVDWKIRSTGYVKNINGQNFHRDRGAASTFTYDVAAFQNYMIQGQADNGVLESWDGGLSWRQAIMFQAPQGLTDAHGVQVIERPNGSGIVLVSASKGFGGGNRSEGAYLLYKNLDLTGPDGTADGFSVIKTAAANSATAVGLPNSRIWEFHQDPNDLKRLYVATEKGIWVCDDIFDLIDGGTATFRDINGVNGSVNTRSFGEAFAFADGDSNVIFLQCASGLWRGVRSGTNYTWTQMTRGGDVGNGNQTNLLKFGGVASVKKGSNTYTYSFTAGSGVIRTDGNPNTFEKVALSLPQALGIVGTPTWWSDFTDPEEREIQIADMVAVNGVLYIPLQKWDKFKVGYGFVKGTVQNNGDVVWEDWTSDVDYPVVRQVKSYTTNGTQKILMATRGSGVLARKVNGQRGDTKPPIDEDAIVLPQPPEFFTIFTDNFPANNLQWSVQSPDGTLLNSPSSGQASEGNNSRYMQGLSKSVDGNREKLIITFESVKATGGTLKLDLFGIGGAMNAVNVKLVDKFNGYVDVNNTTVGSLLNIPGSRFTTFSIPIGGGTLDAGEFSRIEIEKFSDGVDKLYIDNIIIEGDNIDYSGTGTVQVDQIVLTPETITLDIGESFTINAQVTPSNAPDKRIGYQSSNGGVAAAQGATITANSAGTATITGTAVAGGATDQVVVTVRSPVTTFRIKNKQTGKYLRAMNTNNSYLRVGSNDGSDWYIWEKVATTGAFFHLKNQQTGKYIRPGNANDNSNIRQRPATEIGTYTQWQETPGTGGAIRFENRNTGFPFRPTGGNDAPVVQKVSDTSDWTQWIIEPTNGTPPSGTPVAGVSLSPTSLVLNIGQNGTLNTTVSPNNADNQNVNYSSSNSGIATVNSSGAVSAISAGTATITVTTVDGGFTATATVTVPSGPPPSGNFFRIRNKETGQYLRAMNTNNSYLRLEADAGGDWYIWEKEATDSGHYYLINKETGKKMRPRTTSLNDYVRQANATDTNDWVQWRETSGTGGAVHLVNRETGNNIRHTPLQSVTAVIQVTPNTTNATQWIFEPASASLKTQLPELVSEKEIRLYPNPAHTELYIVNMRKDAPYSLYDVTGKLVQSGTFESQVGEERIDVSTLGAGMYFLKVSEQNFKVVIDN